jgi:hypothetical protein
MIGLLAAPTEKVVLQVPRALVASVLAAAVDVGLLIGLKEGAGWDPVVAAVVSYLVGGVVQYLLCACWVFPNSPQSVAVGFAAFTFLSLVGLAMTAARRPPASTSPSPTWPRPSAPTAPRSAPRRTWPRPTPAPSPTTTTA